MRRLPCGALASAFGGQPAAPVCRLDKSDFPRSPVADHCHSDLCQSSVCLSFVSSAAVCVVGPGEEVDTSSGTGDQGPRVLVRVLSMEAFIPFLTPEDL